MKKINSIILALILISFFAALISGCHQPSPLTGTWSDNDGNKIVFADDGTFNAIIKYKDGTKETYSGMYSVLENVISFSKSDGNANTEWDIRGSLLYLTWTSQGKQIALTLYRTA